MLLDGNFSEILKVHVCNLSIFSFVLNVCLTYPSYSSPSPDLDHSRETGSESWHLLLAGVSPQYHVPNTTASSFIWEPCITFSPISSVVGFGSHSPSYRVNSLCLFKVVLASDKKSSLYNNCVLIAVWLISCEGGGGIICMFLFGHALGPTPGSINLTSNTKAPTFTHTQRPLRWKSLSLSPPLSLSLSLSLYLSLPLSTSLFPLHCLSHDPSLLWCRETCPGMFCKQFGKMSPIYK